MLLSFDLPISEMSAKQRASLRDWCDNHSWECPVAVWSDEATTYENGKRVVFKTWRDIRDWAGY